MIRRQQETWWFRKIDNMKDDARMLGKTVTRHETAIQDFQAKVPICDDVVTLRVVNPMIGAQDLNRGLKEENVMEIDEGQCAYGGNVGRVSFSDSGGQFEGVNLGSPLVRDAVTREKERVILLLCAVLRENMCWLFDSIGHKKREWWIKVFQKFEWQSRHTLAEGFGQILVT